MVSLFFQLSQFFGQQLILVLKPLFGIFVLIITFRDKFSGNIDTAYLLVLVPNSKILLNTAVDHQRGDFHKAIADRVVSDRVIMPYTQCDILIRFLDIELERVVEGRLFVLVVGNLCLHFSVVMSDSDKGAHVAEH